MSEKIKEANHLGAVLGIIDEGATLASALLPQYRVYVLLGAAIARQVPGLYEDVLRLLEKGEPTADEKVELYRKLRALQRPEADEAQLRVES